MQATCTYKQGSLPGCAPLALAQIPAQQSSEPAYKSGEALMALDFVTAELNLYLDTQSSDTQAVQTLQSFLKMYEEGRKEYVARFGPLSLSDLATAKSYTWLNDPWPWDYVSKEG